MRVNKVQMDLIHSLWKSVSQIGAKTTRERRLRVLCEKIAKVSDPIFLTKEQGDEIIDHLKKRFQKQTETYKRSSKMLLHSLSPRQRSVIRKEYPFHSERDRLFRDLRKQGITYVLLSKVSGFGLTWIYMILKGGCADDREGRKKIKRAARSQR